MNQMPSFARRLTRIMLSAVIIALPAVPSVAATPLASNRMVVTQTSNDADIPTRLYSILTTGGSKTLLRDGLEGPAGDPTCHDNNDNDSDGVTDAVDPDCKAAWGPRLSPDRQQVLFYTGDEQHADEIQLWRMNVDGSSEPILVVSAGYDPDASGIEPPWEQHGHAEWSPDGDYLVMSAGSLDTPQLWVWDLAAGTAGRISTLNPNIAYLTPSWNPDQGSVVYARCPTAATCAGTDREIYLMSAYGDFHQDIRLTTDTATKYNDTEPYLEPTGSTVLFRRMVGCFAQIFKVPVTGGTPTAVVNDAAANVFGKFARDGSTVYYERYPAGTQWKLARVARTGGTKTDIALASGNCNQEFPNLTHNSPTAVSTDGPGRLPMGRMVVATNRTDGPTGSDHNNHEIYSMNLNGTGQTRLTYSTDEVWWPQLSPDRTKILYYKGDIEDYDRISLWKMNWDGSGQSEIIPEGGPPGQTWFSHGHASWSPDGNWIVMLASSFGLPTQIWRTDSNGGNVLQLSGYASGALLISHIDPSWSTDQAWILYTRCPTASPCGASNFEVYAMSVYGDHIADVRLTNDNFRDHDPYMSPDGAEIAFLRQVSCNRWGIFKIPTGATYPITAATTVYDDGGINSLPAWTRDSSQIYFHRLPSGTKTDIWKVNINGSGKAALSTGSDHCGLSDPDQSAVFP